MVVQPDPRLGDQLATIHDRAGFLAQEGGQCPFGCHRTGSKSKDLQGLLLMLEQCAAPAPVDRPQGCDHRRFHADLLGNAGQHGRRDQPHRVQRAAGQTQEADLHGKAEAIHVATAMRHDHGRVIFEREEVPDLRFGQVGGNRVDSQQPSPPSLHAIPPSRIPSGSERYGGADGRVPGKLLLSRNQLVMGPLLPEHLIFQGPP